MSASVDRDPQTRVGAPHPWLVGLLCLVLGLMFVSARVATYDGDVTALIRIGEEIVQDGEPPPPDLHLTDGIGYDGQFFYRQALDPLSTDPEVEGIPLDRPVYRSARVLYPVVVWAASLGGQRTLVPWAMAGVNVLAVGLIGALGARLARESGRRTWWGVAFAFWPGLVIGLAYNLAEPLEALCVIGAIACFRERRPLLGAAALSAAALARESALVVAAGVVAAGFLRPLLPMDALRLGLGRKGPHPGWGVPPFLTYLGMQLWMSRRWEAGAGTGAAKSADQVDSPPFAKLGRQIVDWVLDAGPVEIFQLIQVLVLLCVLTCFAVSLRDRAAGISHERLAFVGGLLLLTTVGGWDRMVVYLRWPTVTVFLGLAVFLGSSACERPGWVRERTVAMMLGSLTCMTVPIWIFI